MKRVDLIHKIMKKHPELSQSEVENMIAIFTNDIGDAMARGDVVSLRGFGTFSRRYRKERVARNPKSGVAVAVEGKYVPFFKFVKSLHNLLNN